MNIKVPLIALSILAATALPVAQADAKKLPKTAYFEVRFGATQSIDWTLDETSQSCGVVHTTGHGKSLTKLNSGDFRPVTVKRSGSHVRFLFPGKTTHPDVDLPVFGTVERFGEEQGSVLQQPDPPCPKPLPIAPDCGQRPYPGGTRLALLWSTPADWESTDGRRPHSPSLHIRGPYGPGLPNGIQYQNCIGERDDSQLGFGTSPRPGVDSGSADLPLSTLFGKNQKRFKVTGVTTGRIPHVTPTGVTGEMKSSLTLRWWVEFKRLTHPGKPHGIDPAPLT